MQNFRDHLVEPVGVEVVEWLLQVADFGWEFKNANGKLPAAQHYAATFSKGKITDIDRAAAWNFSALHEFFEGHRPAELSAETFDVLRSRWGAKDGSVSRIRDAVTKGSCTIEELLQAERDLLRRLGWLVRQGGGVQKAWAHL